MTGPASFPPDARASFRDWVAVIGAALGAFVAVIDIQITNASLKQIQGSLAASLDEGSWISTGYLIAEMVVIPMTVWLSSVFSFRRYLAGTTLLFILFSVLCGLSTSLPEMVVFRVGQGFTGGSLIPAAFTMAATIVPPSQRTISTVVSGVSISLAPAIGPSIGGWLTDTFSWHYIFYINVVPGLAVVGMILYGLKPSPMQFERLKDADYPGMLAMAIGLGTLEVVLEEGQRKDWFSSPLIRDCAVVAAISLVTAIGIELTTRSPFINLKLLRKPAFAALCVCALVTGLGMYGLSFLLPLYLAQIQNYTAGQIGRLMVWQGLPQVLMFPLLPVLMRRIDLRILIAVGFVIFACTAFMNVGLTHDSGGPQMLSALLGRAIGLPAVLLALSTLVPSTLPTREIPDASALYNTMRNLGGSIGIALLSTFATVREQFHFSMIAERMGDNSVQLQERVALIARRLADGGTAAMAEPRAIASLAQTVRREAFVMAYSDCFFIMGVIVLGCLAIIPLLARPARAGAAPAGGH